MSAIRAELIERARERDGEISPCKGKRSLAECFTEYGGQMVLWYNTASGDTHVVSEAIT